MWTAIVLVYIVILNLKIWYKTFCFHSIYVSYFHYPFVILIYVCVRLIDDVSIQMFGYTEWCFVLPLFGVEPYDFLFFFMHSFFVLSPKSQIIGSWLSLLHVHCVNNSFIFTYASFAGGIH